MSESPMSRFSLASVLVLVGVVAAELAAMRAATDLVAQWACTLALLVLAVGLLGAIVRRGGGWIGFALFGWGYALVALVPAIQAVAGPLLPIKTPLEGLVSRLHPQPTTPTPPKFNPQSGMRPGDMEILPFLGKDDFRRTRMSAAERKALDDYQAEHVAFQSQWADAVRRRENASRVAQLALGLIAGLVGSAFGLFLSRTAPPAPPRVVHDPPGVGQAHQPTVGSIPFMDRG